MARVLLQTTAGADCRFFLKSDGATRFGRPGVFMPMGVICLSTTKRRAVVMSEAQAVAWCAALNANAQFLAENGIVNAEVVS
jgi:hypothetical protein